MPTLLLGFGTIGVPGVIIILIVVLIVFGPSKLPALGEGVGKMLRGFKREMQALDDDKPRVEEKAVDRVATRDDGPEIDVTPRGESDNHKA